MSYSLNEVETLAKRAARGAGLDWGLAEEAGKALRWLLQRDLPGPALFAALLDLQAARSYDDMAPADEGLPWRAPGGALSPLLAGPALSDRAAELAAGAQIRLAETAFPLLLLPYLAAAAKSSGRAMTLAWPGLEIAVAAPGTAPGTLPADLAVSGDRAQLTATATPQATIAAGDPPQGCEDAAGEGAAGSARRADLDAAVRTCLERFAQRTYAPASEASRLAGAGAGLSDND